MNGALRKLKRRTPATIGASIQASLEMYKTTYLETYKNFAVSQASRLTKLQSVNREEGISGFFYTSSTDQ